MRHHAGTQAPAPECERTIEKAKDRDLDARISSLIAVGNSEEHGLKEQRDPPTVRVCLKLSLEVSAKDQLFADPRAG